MTEPQRLIAWLAEAQVELTPGGRVELKWLNSESVARGDITAFDPPRLVAYNTDCRLARPARSPGGRPAGAAGRLAALD